MIMEREAKLWTSRSMQKSSAQMVRAAIRPTYSDATTEKITHLVVDEELFPKTEYLVFH